MIAHTFSLSTQEEEAGRSEFEASCFIEQFLGQLGVCREALSQKEKEKESATKLYLLLLLNRPSWPLHLPSECWD